MHKIYTILHKNKTQAILLCFVLLCHFGVFVLLYLQNTRVGIFRQPCQYANNRSAGESSFAFNHTIHITDTTGTGRTGNVAIVNSRWMYHAHARRHCCFQRLIIMACFLLALFPVLTSVRELDESIPCATISLSKAICEVRIAYLVYECQQSFSIVTTNMMEKECM